MAAKYKPGAVRRYKHGFYPATRRAMARSNEKWLRELIAWLNAQ